MNMPTPSERDASTPFRKEVTNKGPAPSTSHDLPLSAELSENKDIVRLRIDVPGIEPKDIQVSVERGVLTVQGTRKSFSIDGKTCLKKRQFIRRYGLNTNAIEAHSVSAALALGVLEIRAKKKPKSHDGVIPVVGNRLSQKRVVIPAEISLLEMDSPLKDERSS
jgi:HSP20 family protein